MKKLFSFITAFTILITFNWVWVQPAQANTVLEKCKWDPFEAIDKTDFSDDKYIAEFEKAQNHYHNYVKCIFDEAITQMLGVSGSGAGSQIAADATVNAPNFPELLKPDVACIDSPELNQLLFDASPEQILPKILTAYSEYKGHLNALVDELRESPEINSATRQNFALLVNRQTELVLMADNEIEYSLIALDTSFIALKEMRQAYVMHVHFMCILNSLESYRKLMENLRSVVEILPALIEDASIHK